METSPTADEFISLERGELDADDRGDLEDAQEHGNSQSADEHAGVASGPGEGMAHEEHDLDSVHTDDSNIEQARASDDNEVDHSPDSYARNSHQDDDEHGTTCQDETYDKEQEDKGASQEQGDEKNVDEVHAIGSSHENKDHQDSRKSDQRRDDDGVKDDQSTKKEDSISKIDEAGTKQEVTRDDSKSSGPSRDRPSESSKDKSRTSDRGGMNRGMKSEDKESKPLVDKDQRPAEKDREKDRGLERGLESRSTERHKEGDNKDKSAIKDRDQGDNKIRGRSNAAGKDGGREADRPKNRGGASDLRPSREPSSRNDVGKSKRARSLSPRNVINKRRPPIVAQRRRPSPNPRPSLGGAGRRRSPGPALGGRRRSPGAPLGGRRRSPGGYRQPSPRRPHSPPPYGRGPPLDYGGPMPQYYGDMRGGPGNMRGGPGPAGPGGLPFPPGPRASHLPIFRDDPYGPPAPMQGPPGSMRDPPGYDARYPAQYPFPDSRGGPMYPGGAGSSYGPPRDGPGGPPFIDPRGADPRYDNGRQHPGGPGGERFNERDREGRASQPPHNSERGRGGRAPQEPRGGSDKYGSGDRPGGSNKFGNTNSKGGGGQREANPRSGGRGGNATRPSSPPSKRSRGSPARGGGSYPSQYGSTSAGARYPNDNRSSDVRAGGASTHPLPDTYRGGSDMYRSGGGGSSLPSTDPYRGGSDMYRSGGGGSSTPYQSGALPTQQQQQQQGGSYYSHSDVGYPATNRQLPGGEAPNRGATHPYENGPSDRYGGAGSTPYGGASLDGRSSGYSQQHGGYGTSTTPSAPNAFEDERYRQQQQQSLGHRGTSSSLPGITPLGSGAQGHGGGSNMQIPGSGSAHMQMSQGHGNGGQYDLQRRAMDFGSGGVGAGLNPGISGGRNQAPGLPSSSLPPGLILDQRSNVSQLGVPALPNVQPDDKVWLYADPQGKVQGPCSLSDFRKWVASLQEPTYVKEYNQFLDSSVWAKGSEASKCSLTQLLGRYAL